MYYIVLMLCLGCKTNLDEKIKQLIRIYLNFWKWWEASVQYAIVHTKSEKFFLDRLQNSASVLDEMCENDKRGS